MPPDPPTPKATAVFGRRVKATVARRFHPQAHAMKPSIARLLFGSARFRESQDLLEFQCKKFC
jgi:hypothetical protein